MGAMFQDTQPAALGSDGGPDPWAEFRVDHPGEILALMRRLRDGTVRVNLSAPTGAALGTTLWSVDDQRGRLNFSLDGEPPGLAGMIEADELTAVVYLDSVKLQFDLHELLVVRSLHSAALQAALPRELYRFQRRSAYRVRTPERGSPTARMRHPAIPEMALALRVIDVSTGGCALFLPADVPSLAPGTQIVGVRIDLDPETRFETTLQLQHVTAIQPGQSGVRIGCAWQQMPAGADRVLQRYIDQTQKRIRLMARGG